MTDFFAEIRLYRPDGHYWTLNVQVEADTLVTAAHLLTAIQTGVKMVSKNELIFMEVSSSRTRNRDYRPLSHNFFPEVEEFLSSTTAEVLAREMEKE